MDRLSEALEELTYEQMEELVADLLDEGIVPRGWFYTDDLLADPIAELDVITQLRNKGYTVEPK